MHGFFFRVTPMLRQRRFLVTRHLRGGMFKNCADAFLLTPHSRPTTHRYKVTQITTTNATSPYFSMFPSYAELTPAGSHASTELQSIRCADYFQ